MGDFTPDAMFTPDATVTISRKGGSATTITTRVSNFTEGGGTKDIEKFDLFGAASITVKKTQDPFEVGFDSVIKDTDWAFVMTGSLSTAGSATQVISQGTQTEYKVKIEWADPIGSAFYKLIYYNALGVTYEKEWEADSFLKATVGFKLTPTSAVGSGQRYEVELFDTGDTTGSASYVTWETTADTLFGY